MIQTPQCFTIPFSAKPPHFTSIASPNLVHRLIFEPKYSFIFDSQSSANKLSRSSVCKFIITISCLFVGIHPWPFLSILSLSYFTPSFSTLTISLLSSTFPKQLLNALMSNTCSLTLFCNTTMFNVYVFNWTFSICLPYLRLLSLPALATPTRTLSRLNCVQGP